MKLSSFVVFVILVFWRYNMFKSSMFLGICCAAIMMCSGANGVPGMNEEAKRVETSAGLSTVQNDRPPNYSSGWVRRSCESGGTLTKVGYTALQKDYPHKMANFEATKEAMENILADIKSGTFKNPGIQAVLDYMDWWYDSDPEQVYKLEIWKDPVTGRGRMRIREYEIRDIAAQILDELRQTGGTAYATLHWCDRK
jgi:hypothetical protein